MISIRVVSRSGSALASPLAAQFGDTVGDIGRGADCTLVLPDPERQISRKQVLITSRAGHHFICAIGNPAMVELDGMQLVPDTEYPLEIGARIRIGPYLLCVDKLASSDESEAAVPAAMPPPLQPQRSALPPRMAPAPPTARPPAPVPGHGAPVPQPPAARPAAPSFAAPAHAPTHEPGRAAFEDAQRFVLPERIDDPLAIFGSSARAAKSSLFGDLLETSLSVPPLDPPAAAPPAAQPAKITVPEQRAASVPAQQAAGAASASAARAGTPAPRSEAAPAPGAEPALDALAAALYAGLGTSVPGLARLTPEHAGLIGALLRATLTGTLELLAARTIAKRELGASSTLLMARENNPLKFSPDVDAALSHLLGPPERGFIAPLDAVRDAFGDLRAHQVAVLAGMRAALDEVLARFDPQALEQRLAPGALWDKVVPASRKAKLWEAYSERYADILREVEGDFETLFGRAFAQAYKAQLDELARGPGADGPAQG